MNIDKAQALIALIVLVGGMVTAWTNLNSRISWLEGEVLDLEKRSTLLTGEVISMLKLLHRLEGSAQTPVIATDPRGHR